MALSRYRSRDLQRVWVALLILLNLGGGPMAWAHLASPATVNGAATVDAGLVAEHCAQHATQEPANPASGHHGATPCCGSQASCFCGCPSASLAAPALISDELRFVWSEVAPFAGLLEPPAIPPHDLFRPPII